MGLHKDFPQSPHTILDPGIRWFPTDEALRESSMEKNTNQLRSGNCWRPSRNTKRKYNKTLHRMAIPLFSIAAGEFYDGADATRRTIGAANCGSATLRPSPQGDTDSPNRR
jgi:hypothetical protein